MANRGLTWAGLYGRGLLRRAVSGRRRKPVAPARVLIAHHLLLGDTILLTALLARLRQAHPAATIAMTCPKAIAPLYSGRPYNAEVLAFDMRDAASIAALCRSPGYDLALIPGDNRFSWLAQAMGARWIRAFSGDRPAYKSWPVDEFIDYPATPATLADMMALLADAPPAPAFGAMQWPAPACRSFERPTRPYAVLHVGARSPLRLWQAARWRMLAQYLAGSGLEVVLSAGRGEEALVPAVDPDGRYRAYAGTLDLAQLWHLLHDARLLVCPDTGIAHLAKIAAVPTVALFGPGSAVLFDKGEFWRDNAFMPVTIADFPCRDQPNVFKRRIDWVRHCARSLGECTQARCMDALDFDRVKAAVDTLLGRDAERAIATGSGTR